MSPAWDIRRSLYLLLACVTLPALAIILYVGLAQRGQAVEEASGQLANLASSMATIQAEKTSHIRVMLQTLSSVTMVRELNTASCATLFADTMRNDPAIANILLVDLDGNELVSARQGFRRFNYADRSWFKDAVRTKEFSVGEYGIGRILGQTPIMQFSYPLLGEDGTIFAVLCAAYDLKKLEGFFNNLVLPRNCRATLIDRNGLRYLSLATQVEPLPRGEPVRADLWDEIAGSEDASGQFFTHRFEGGPALFRFCKIRLKPNDTPYATVMLSIPLEVVFKNANDGLLRNLGLLALAAILAILIARILGNRLVLTQVDVLKQSEDRYRSLFENMNTGFVLFGVIQDDQGRPVDLEVLAANGRFMHATGLTSQAIGKRLTQIVPGIEDDAADWIGTYGSIALSGEPRQFEKGSERLGAYYSVAAYQAGPKQCGVTFIDVTERRRAEQARQESLEQLDLVLEGSQLGFWDWNLETGEVRRNDRWAIMLGYSKEEVESTVWQWRDHLHPDDVDRAWRSIEDHLDGRTPMHRAEYRMRSKSGGYFWILDQAQVVRRDDAGKPLRMCGTHTDITDRKLAEEALHDSEIRFRDLFDLSPVPLAYVARDGRMLDLNERFVQVFGYSLEDIPALESWRVRAYPDPQYRQEATSHWNKALSEDNGSLRELPPGEYRVTCKDGSVRIAHISGIVASGGILSSLVDITDYKRLEERLKLSKELAEDASRAKSAFLANMSHEIRTPLNGILGMLQLLETTAANAEQKEYIDSAIRSSKRLTGLLSDILDLSRIEAGKMTMQRSRFEMESLRQSVVDLFERPAQGKGLSFAFELDPGLPASFVGDVTRVRQILFNLVGNAIKFTQDGGVRVIVEPLRRRDASQWVLFIVSDSGIGISDNQMKEIFLPFTQVENSYTRRFQGAGLGLSIVKKLVGLMGGSLALESPEGVGTIAYFSVLLEVPEAVQANLELDRTDAVIDQDQPTRILLAEDESVNRIAYKRLLEKSGFIVSAVSNGADALKLLHEHDYDVILMDIQMPVMNGIEATQLIRSSAILGDKSRITIVAMTAYAMEGDREKFSAAGMDDYISKPIDRADLDRVLARVARTMNKKA